MIGPLGLHRGSCSMSDEEQVWPNRASYTKCSNEGLLPPLEIVRNLQLKMDLPMLDGRIISKKVTRSVPRHLDMDDHVSSSPPPPNTTVTVVNMVCLFYLGFTFS